MNDQINYRYAEKEDFEAIVNLLKENDKTFSWHKHESEQITYVLEGKLFFEINNLIYRLDKGESIIVPSNIPHKVWTQHSKVKAIDAWSPVNNML